MWYRKAIDLSELKRQFPEEAKEATEEFQDQNKADDIFKAFESGEEYKSPSGAISVKEAPEFEEFTLEELDSNFKFYSEGMVFWESIRDFPQSIDFMIEKLNIIDPFIDPYYKTEAIRKLENIKRYWTHLSDKYEKIVKPEYEMLYQGEFSRVTPEDMEIASLLLKNQTKIANELLPRIRTRDAQEEWLRVMANRGVPANFMRKDLKEKYKEIMNQKWRY